MEKGSSWHVGSGLAALFRTHPIVSVLQEILACWHPPESGPLSLEQLDIQHFFQVAKFAAQYRFGNPQSRQGIGSR